MISGKARVAAIIGWPVGHSLSPRLHGFWLEKYEIDGAYVPLAIHPDNFETAFRSLAALGFAGTNVTLPHKEQALACVDVADDEARRIGAANTITVREDGSLHGGNSDAFGFRENLIAELPGWDPKAAPAVVVGAGGSARAICVALMDLGVPEIRLVNRTASRAESLARDLGGPFSMIPWENRAAVLDGAGLLVNTTAMGMSGNPPLDLDLGGLPPEAVVTDIVYTPLETPLLAAARNRGNPVVDGMGMLLHQGRPGFAKWFGVEPEVTEDLRAFVLAGLPRAPGE
ncbi:MAG: shikimate dehydrogenase [Rhodospirillales bacterium]|nr:shikimate dehydrogenase [Rhodospirillales bacterium]